MPRNWHSLELELVRENLTMNSHALAEKLSALYERRTPKAVYQMQRRLRGAPGSCNPNGSGASLDFDRRPSGWYAEVIGRLLFEYPDALRTWQHYHRYVEMRHVSSGGGWVTLLCRRDADAP